METKSKTFTFAVERVITEKKKGEDLAHAFQAVFDDIKHRALSRVAGTGEQGAMSFIVKPSLKYKTASHESWIYDISRASIRSSRGDVDELGKKQ